MRKERAQPTARQREMLAFIDSGGVFTRRAGGLRWQLVADHGPLSSWTSDAGLSALFRAGWIDLDVSPEATELSPSLTDSGGADIGETSDARRPRPRLTPPGGGGRQALRERSGVDVVANGVRRSKDVGIAKGSAGLMARLRCRAVERAEQAKAAAITKGVRTFVRLHLTEIMGLRKLAGTWEEVASLLSEEDLRWKSGRRVTGDHLRSLIAEIRRSQARRSLRSAPS